MTVLPLPNPSAIRVLPSEPARPVHGADQGVQPARAAGDQAAKDRPSAEHKETAPPRENEAARQAQVEAVVAQLKARDREVRAHEMAHLAAAGSYATSGPHYVYQSGPDGRRYAIGGEVGIDISPEADPEKTLAKMQVVQQAALAPANPSPQDMRVAAAAAQAMAQAQAELARQRVEGDAKDAPEDTNPAASGGEKGLPAKAPQHENESKALSLVAAGEAARNAWAQRLAIQQGGVA